MRRLTVVVAGALVAAVLAGNPVDAAGGKIHTIASYVDLRGVSITAPPGWAFQESAGGVVLVSPDFKPATQKGALVEVFTNPYGALCLRCPILRNAHTPPALVDFLLHHHPKLIASPAPARTIGGLPALGVDLRVSPDAGKEDPGCAAACATWIRFRHGCCIGTDTYTWVRVYFTTIGRGKNVHTMLALFEGDPHSASRKWLPTAQQIFDSITLPASLRT
jgi:hypothetical protein